MATKKISELTDLSSPDDADELAIVDTSASTTKSITWANLKTAIQTFIEGLASYFNVSSDTLDDITNGATYVKSENNLTDTLKTKLDGVEAGATADQTGAEIKTAYEGEADTNAYTDAEKTKLAGIEASADVTDSGNVGSSIHGSSAKSTPVDADTMPLIDSAASNVLKKVTWANIKSVLQTAFDSIYAPIAKGVTNGDSHDHSGGDGGQIDHTGLSNKGTNSHSDIDTHISDSSKHLTGASSAEVNTGTETGKAVTPDALAGSNSGIRYIQVTVFDYTTDLETGDGKAYFHIPPALNGMNLVYCHAEVITAGTTNTSDIQIHNVTDSQDMLSTKLTVDTGETGSDTAATAYVINTSYDDVATNDLIRVDIDQISTTAPKGLILTLGFQLA